MEVHVRRNHPELLRWRVSQVSSGSIHENWSLMMSEAIARYGTHGTPS